MTIRKGNNIIAGCLDNDASVVHLTGNEGISGNKYFKNTIFRQNDNDVRSTTPSTIKQSQITFVDQNAAVCGVLEYTHDINGDSKMTISVVGEDGNYIGTPFRIGKTISGTSFTSAPTPAVSSNTTEIATTAYINTKFQVVSALPASPDPDTYYFIPES